jgi:hypothetical protein
LNYGFGSFDITHPNYSTSVQYLTAAAYNVIYTITNPNNGSGETCIIAVNANNPIVVTNGQCNATMVNQTYYTGNLPATTGLCASGNLTGLTQTMTGWSWSCEGINGGSTDTACTLAISYCGDGVL